VLVAFVLTLTRLTDIPVFWPILVVYFCVLFGMTMKKQIAHMVKYKYLPFDLGKARYASGGKGGKGGKAKGEDKPPAEPLFRGSNVR
jgi:hypothetical protein